MERTAEWTVEQADAWIAQNPNGWERMKRDARFYTAHGMRFSIRELADVCRYHMATSGTCDGYKMNNSLHPVFARRLIQEVPECAQYLEIRRSKVDAVMTRA